MFDLSSALKSRYAPVGFFVGGIGLFWLTDSLSKKKPSIHGQVAWAATVAGVAEFASGRFGISLNKSHVFLGLLGGSLLNYNLHKTDSILRASSSTALTTASAALLLKYSTNIGKVVASSIKSSGILSKGILKEGIDAMYEIVPPKFHESFGEDSIISGLSISIAGLSIPAIGNKINDLHDIPDRKDKTKQRGIHLRFKGSHKFEDRPDKKEKRY